MLTGKVAVVTGSSPALFPASDTSAWLTGQIIDVAGGAVMA